MDLTTFKSKWQELSVSAEEELSLPTFVSLVSSILVGTDTDKLNAPCKSLFESMMQGSSEDKKPKIAISQAIESKDDNPLNDFVRRSSTSLQTIAGDVVDDDDDEDEDVEPEASTKPKLTPILRGHLKEKNGKIMWTGKWAMSQESFKQGDKAPFKYVYVGTQDVAGCVKDGKVVKPCTGLYSGSFMVKDGEDMNKIKEKNVNLKFKKDDDGQFDVEGKGSNKFGDFSISGRYEPESGRLAVFKTYIAEESDDDDDDLDDDIDDDGEDAAAELAALQAENEIPVEELKKRYAEMEAKAAAEESAAKKARTE